MRTSVIIQHPCMCMKRQILIPTFSSIYHKVTYVLCMLTLLSWYPRNPTSDNNDDARDFLKLKVAHSNSKNVNMLQHLIEHLNTDNTYEQPCSLMNCDKVCSVMRNLKLKDV